MIRTAFVKMLIIASTFVSCSILNSCASNTSGDISVTLEGQMGAFNETKTISTLNLSTSPNTALKNVSGYKIPTPYFEEVQFFGYWSLDAEGKNVVDENYIIKNDTTFFAQYGGDFPEDVSYILFDSSAYSSLVPDRSAVCFTAAPEIKKDRYNLKITSNVDAGKMAVTSMKVNSPTLSGGDSYCCIFNHSGPVVIKIQGLCREFSFTRFTSEPKKEQKLVVPISPGNNHIIAFACNGRSKKISKSGFQNLSSIKAVHYSKYVDEFEKFAFSSCTSLEYISKMPYLTNIPDNAFFDCRKLRHFNFSSILNLNEIGSNAFEGCQLLKSFACPRTCTVVGGRAFANCINLTDVTFEEGNLSSIGDEAFIGCTSLCHIRLPKSLRYICAETFANCTNLTDVTFVNGSLPLEIAESVFANCSNLCKITLPRQALYAHDGCFQNSNLSELDLSRINSVIDYKTNLFKYTPLASKQGKIIVSQNLLSAYQSASGWSDYKDIIVAK